MRQDPRHTQLDRPTTVEAAVRAHEGEHTPYLAGGTTLVDLLQLGHAPPQRLVHLGGIDGDFSRVLSDGARVVLGAGVTMADAARHPVLQHGFPALVDALRQAASPQVRAMATLGGNLLQRTRCPYFRDVDSPCHKREPGSGCSAIGGDTRSLAILGTSEHCIANYAGDLAVALVALGGRVRTRTLDGTHRVRPVAELYRLPGATPWRETQLEAGELIVAVEVPRVPGRRSRFVKARDRASYAFALASCAAAASFDPTGNVTTASVALGGIATRPWPCEEASGWLVGRRIDSAVAAEAAARCIPDLVSDSHRAFKVDLARRVVQRTLLDLWEEAAP